MRSASSFMASASASVGEVLVVVGPVEERGRVGLGAGLLEHPVEGAVRHAPRSRRTSGARRGARAPSCPASRGASRRRTRSGGRRPGPRDPRAGGRGARCPGRSARPASTDRRRWWRRGAPPRARGRPRLSSARRSANGFDRMGPVLYHGSRAVARVHHVPGKRRSAFQEKAGQNGVSSRWRGHAGRSAHGVGV